MSMRATEAATEHQEAGGAAVRLRRIGLLSLMAVIWLNIWTGSPLAALWLGSRIQGSGPASMGAIAFVAVTWAALGLSLVWVLGVVGGAYDRLAGRGAATRHHVPWLRSMRGERTPDRNAKIGVTPIEVIAIASVFAAVIAFEIWFFFYSGSPIDGRSGR